MRYFANLTMMVAVLFGTLLPVGAQTRGTYPVGKALPQPPMRVQPMKSAQSKRVTSDVFPIGVNHRNSFFDTDALSVPSTPAKAPQRVLGDGTIIYGSMLYSSTWAGTTGKKGIYSFPAGNYVLPTLVAEQDYYATGGGCLGGDIYYYNDYVYTDEMGYTFVTFCKYNIRTGEFERIIHSFMEETFDQSQITHDMAWDPTEGRIYAVSYIKKIIVEDALAKFVPAISEIDPYSGLVTPIAETPQFAAIACTESGELYGISMGDESALYRINKSNGDCIEIGKTGLNPAYVQSAAFDPITNKLYWAATLSNMTTGLYEVNIATGRAHKITDFDNMEEYAGLYIPAPDVQAAAPAMVASITPNFVNGALSGSVTVTAPTTTFGGQNLSGDVIIHISVDGEEVVSKSVAVGGSVKQDLTLTEGIHGFVAYAENASGAGPRSGNAVYVGIDAPEAPRNIAVQHNEDGTATISWDAPQIGRNDGYINPSELKYNVTRMPDCEQIATGISTLSYTDALDVKSANYWYEVTAEMDGREGPAAITEAKPLGRGTGLPCKFSFDTKADFELCTTIDVGNNYEAEYHWGAWMYSPEFPAVANTAEGENPCAVYGQHPEYAADDWLITPSFTVEEGKKYRVTYYMWTRGDKEKLAVTAGPLNTVDAQQVIHEATEYKHKDKQQFIHEFTATASGNYYVGFHITSSKKRYYLFVDDIMIDEVADTSSPQPVSDLTATPGEQGALSATLTMTAPTKTMGNETLSSISHIDIFRGNNPQVIHSFETPTPGEQLTWTDNSTGSGWCEYRVVAYNAAGLAGEKAETRVFVGIDQPLAVQYLTLSDASGQPVLTWDVPTESVNGGYFNPDELTYQIVRNDGVILSRNARGTSFTDNTLDPAEKQYFIYYAVTPMSISGGTAHAYSNQIVYGDPYPADFFESFSDAYTQNDPWTLHRVKGDTQLWTLATAGSDPICYPADDDDGVAIFQSSYDARSEGRMISPKIDFSSYAVPMFSFCLYHYASDNTLYGEDPYEDRLYIEFMTPEGEFIPFTSEIYVDDANMGEGWYQYTYDLSDFKDYGWGRLSFHGVSAYGQDITIDRVAVESKVLDDLGIYTFAGPAEVAAGKKAVYKGVIANYGVNEAVNYDVILLRDGVEIARQNTPMRLKSKSQASVKFGVIANESEIGKDYSYAMQIVYNDDTNAANDKSQIVNTHITAPQYPEVHHLNGSVDNDGNVTLSWGDADVLRVDDKFENYTAFTIDEIGDYTLVDGDAANTYGFADLYFENTGEPMAYIVFNPDVLGITRYLPEYGAHSGSQVLASFAAVDYATGASVQNNDWIITPELVPGSTFSFWAKTANYEWGYESFEVMCSSGSTSTTAFRVLDAVSEVPSEWTRYEYVVPEDAKYMAIHYNASDRFLFYIDDMNYTAHYSGNAFTLTGFRVYRDGEAIADLPATQHSYTDKIDEQGKHRYTVRALYGNSESAPSDEFVAYGTGIENVAADAPAVTVDGKVITINCADGVSVVISDAQGVCLYNSVDGEMRRFAVASAGVYIVTIDGKPYKVMVK